jgi:hypothetical protein
MKDCELLPTIQNLFEGFNQFTQLIFSFALGLAFSQANITVGWIFFWIVVWELGVYLFFANSVYYDPFFRVAYNCVFILSILFGQYLYFGQTTFQNFLYPNSITKKKVFTGTKYETMKIIENLLDDYIDNEDKKLKKKKISKTKSFFIN